MMKVKLAQKLYDENLWHMDITISIIFQSFMHLTSFVFAILVKFYFVSPFVPILDATSLVPQLTTRL